MSVDDLQVRSQAYEGIAFHPDLGSGKVSGQLSVSSVGLRFEADCTQVELPLDGLEVASGGASHRLVFFSHRLQPAWSLYTSNRRILNHPHLQSRTAIAAQCDKIRGEKNQSRLITSLMTLAIVAAVIGLYQLKAPLVALVARHIPASVEIRLGEVAFSQLKLSRVLIEDDELEARLRDLAAPLLEGVENERDYPFNLHIVADPSINAFALPGGHMVVHTGLLLKAREPEEVLGVLAHEIAHVTRQHSLRQLIGTVGLFTLVQTVFGDFTGLIAVLTDGGTKLLRLQFSRDFEREADDIGWDALVRADINPGGLITFFETLREEHDKARGPLTTAQNYLNFLSTHPATEERIERLKTKWLNLDSDFRAIPTELDFRAFQRAIQGYVASSSEAGEFPRGSEN